jgi:hypothetical protein
MASNNVVFSKDEQLEFGRISQSRSLPGGYVFRPRLIVMLCR